jgi:hypothetical protein
MPGDSFKEHSIGEPARPEQRQATTLFGGQASCLLALEDELEDELPQNSSGSDAPEAQKRPILSVFCAGGAQGGRTPDLLIANEEGLDVARRLRVASSPEVPIHAIVC